MNLLDTSLTTLTVMRLGKKKEKDRDSEKEQCVDGVARLICSANKSHQVPLRGKFEISLKKKKSNSINSKFHFNYYLNSVH